MIFAPLSVLLDWNPQFFREVKGRLTRRNAAIAIAASLVFQGLLLMGFNSVLPARYNTSNRYCTGESENYYLPSCIPDAFGNPVINWELWWLHVFQTLSWILAVAGLAAGVYLLISDLAHEEQRGTLNFIRLSPQPSQHILWGKIWGVPILPYLAIALAIPLHLHAGLQADLSTALIACLYIGFVATCGLAFVTALLLVSLGIRQAWVGLIGVCLASTVMFAFWQNSVYTSLYIPVPEWFRVAIGTSLVRSTVWWVISLGVATYWIWVALNRHFRNPNVLLISKRQSYVLTATFEVWLLGLMTQTIEEWHEPLTPIVLFLLVNFLWFMVLAAAITPSRQALLDWARYRRMHQSSTARSPMTHLLTELLTHDKSPATLTLAVNLAIAWGGLAVWFLRWPTSGAGYAITIWTVTLSAAFILTCTVVAQLILFSQIRTKAVLAWVVVIGLVALPPLVLVFGSALPNVAPLLWLCTSFGVAALDYASVSMLVLSSLAHLGALSLLSAQFTLRLRKAGESEFKALLAAGDARPKLIC